MKYTKDDVVLGEGLKQMVLGWLLLIVTIVSGCSTERFVAVPCGRKSVAKDRSPRYCLRSVTIDPRLRKTNDVAAAFDNRSSIVNEYYATFTDNELRDRIAREHPDTFKNNADSIPVNVSIVLLDSRVDHKGMGLHLTTLSMIPAANDFMDEIKIEVSVAGQPHSCNMLCTTTFRASLFPFVLMADEKCEKASYVDARKRLLVGSWVTRCDNAFQKAVEDSIVAILLDDIEKGTK